MEEYSPKLIKTVLDSVHGIDAPPYILDRISTNNGPLPWRPKTAVTEENILKVYNKVTEKHRIKLSELRFMENRCKKSCKKKKTT